MSFGVKGLMENISRAVYLSSSLRVFWEAMQFGLIETYRRFGGTCTMKVMEISV
jgi:hypothetical protein